MVPTTDIEGVVVSDSIALERRPLGPTDVQVSALCVGTAAWGVTSPDHGVVVSEDDAVAAALRVMDGPLNFLDTSNNYGGGEAERRIGLAIRERGGLPDGFVLQTKLDRDPETGSFSASRMRESFEESLERLGLDSVPTVLLHDPEHIGFAEAARPGGPWEATLALKDEGLVEAVGVGGAPTAMLRDFLATGALDVVLTHNRYTLVDRTADALLDEAHAAGVAVMNGAVFAGGVLASYPRTSDLYSYGPGEAQMLGVIDRIGATCADAGVPLAAAALQFSLRDPRVTSTVVGVASAGQVDDALALAAIDIPSEVWTEVESLTPAASMWRND